MTVALPFLDHLDFHQPFNAAPHPYLVVLATPDFGIVAVNDRYLSVTHTHRSDIVGRPLFEVFPTTPPITRAAA